MAETTGVSDSWLHTVLLDDDWLSAPRDSDRMCSLLAARDPAVDGTGAATRLLLSALATAWERGWQPADVVHTVRGRLPARTARLAVALVAEDARTTDAVSRAPDVWVEQLRELGALRRLMWVASGK